MHFKFYILHFFHAVKNNPAIIASTTADDIHRAWLVFMCSCLFLSKDKYGARKR